MTDTRPDALRQLDPMAGRWEVTVSIGGQEAMRGQAAFEWQSTWKHDVDLTYRRQD